MSSEYKVREAAILDKLQKSDLASGLDTLHAQSDAMSARSNVEVTAAQALLDSVTSGANVKDHDTRVAALRKTLTDTRASMDIHVAHLKTVAYEIELRTVRAPMGGKLVDVSACTSGLAVQQGQKLATLLHDSEVHVVSFFRPDDSVGRIMPGQRAALRIDNFPWTQFGTVGAVVDRVGSEPRNDLIRVELRLTKLNGAIPITHGLTTLVEVEVEQTSPMHLLMRSAGQFVVAPAEKPAPTTGTDQPRAVR
jgi:membrane fusion protein (multidrug efflux system)